MRMYDIILKKRNSEELTKEEIDFFIENYTKGEIPDYQASALLMAIFLNKMNERETADLTMAMANSGDILDLSKIEGIKVDKHSTGGVGDTTTLILGPMVAAVGIPVAKMSGRGLGHTGGTIDKLEAIKGFNVNIPEEQFIENVNKIKFALASQTGDLAPADKKIYALRDVTATVDNVTLIASSIMSKKIASGAEAIVLDVKVGEGAFMKTPEDARVLAKEMVKIGKSVNRETVAIISDMDQPLGLAIGNALEVKEAIDTLKGKGPKDLLELCLILGSYMVVLGGGANSEEEARKMLMRVIENGEALNKLKEFVQAQGGDIEIIENTDLLPKAKFIYELKSNRSGYVTKIHSEKVGVVAMELGAGRATKESKIDLAVGIVLNKKRGDRVEEGEVLGYIHANNEEFIGKACKDLLNCYVIEENLGDEVPLIYDVIK